MALNPWNAPQMPGGGANGWQRGPTPAQMGGPGGPMGRGGAPGRDGPPFGWPPHGHPQAMPPQWAAAPHPVHQQAPWQQPTQMNQMPQQHWQGPIDQKNMRMVKMQPQQQPQQWGSHKVDQGTPWEAVPGNVPQGGGKEWQGGGQGNAPWQAPPIPGNAQPQPWQSPEWQQAQPAPSRGEPTPVGQWQPAQGAGAAPPLMAMQPQQWGQPPPMGAAPQQHMQQHNVEPTAARQPQERGMENPGQFGPWVAPYPTDVNNDMMWHDPNPKQKRMQRDIGTQLWGDPSMQAQEIRRWKEHADDEVKPSSSDYNAGWGELPGDRWGHGWTDDHEVSEPFQGGRAAEPHRPEQLEQLTQQISEKLQNAVRKGYVRVDLLERQLPPEKIALLNTLLQKVPKLEQAQQELEQCRRTGLTSVPAKNEADRLTTEIEQLRNEMLMIQSKIAEPSAQRVPPATGAGSRLQQWRKTTTDDAKGLGDLGLGAMSMNDRPDWSTGAEWVQGELGNDMLKDDDGSGDGPREFVPGKKWEWRDPNKVAEDPNATPGLFGGPTLGGMFTTWGGGEGNTWSNSPAPDWVAIQLGPNVGEKTVHATAQQVGSLAQALVARQAQGQIAYLRFHDQPAVQAQAKMLKILPFAQIWTVSDAEVPADNMPQAPGGPMGGWSEASK
ncbi:unnamed protein product, partial [Mesorhabditis belari]|uniref:GW182 middle domain-containing protein n=1 Tax=Mesorhabditis belari TaxID=2138241 RepID=A0AAF3FKR5_9BILA